MEERSRKMRQNAQNLAFSRTRKKTSEYGRLQWSGGLEEDGVGREAGARHLESRFSCPRAEDTPGFDVVQSQAEDGEGIVTG